MILLWLHQLFQLKMIMERLHTLFTNRPLKNEALLNLFSIWLKCRIERSNYCLIDEMSWDVVSATCSTCLNSQTIAAASCMLFMSIQCLLVKCDCSTFHALPSEKLFLEQIYFVSDVSRLQMETIVWGCFGQCKIESRLVAPFLTPFSSL